MATQTAEEALLIRMEVTLNRLEKQMKRADEITKQTANGMEKTLAASNKRIAANADRTAAAVSRVAKANGNNAALQNMSFQLQDVAVQMAGGTSAARALGQQLPQLLSGFGLLGAAMGTAAAVGLGLFDAFLSGGEKAESAAKQLDRLAAATANLREITSMSTEEINEKYGALTEGLQKAIDKQKEFAMLETMDAAKDAIAGLSTGVVDAAEQIRVLQQRIAEYQAMSPEEEQAIGKSSVELILEATEAIGVFEDQLGLTAEEAIRLDDALKKWGAAKTLYEQAEAVSSIQTAIAGTSLETSAWAKDLNQAALELHAAKQAAAEATFNIENAKTAAMALASAVPGAGWLDGAIAGASKLAATLWNAAKARAAATSTGFPTGNDPSGKTYGGRGGDPRQYGANPGETNTFNVENFKVPEVGGGGKGGGGGSRADEYAQETERLLEKIEAMKAETAAYIEAASAQGILGDAAEYAKQRTALLMAAQEQGMTITPELAAEIERLAQEYALAAQNADEARDKMEQVQQASERGKDALGEVFGSILEGSDAAKKAIASLLMEIAKVQMMKGALGILNSMPGGSAVTSWIGGLMSMDGGGYTGAGSRTGGLDGKGGFLAMLHPRETVIDHAKGQRTGGGAQVVQVYVSASEYFDARVDERAASVTRQGIAQFQRQQPDIIRKYTGDPRRRS